MEAQADGLAFTINGPSFRRRIRIANQGDRPAKDVTVQVPELENAAGERVAANGDWKGKTITSLPAHQVAEVTIEATLSTVGEYFTYVDLSSGSRLVVSTRLKVSRADRELEIESVGPNVAEVRRWPWEPDIATSVLLHDTSGLGRCLAVPLLWSLSIKEAEARKTQAAARLGVTAPPQGCFELPAHGEIEIPMQLSHLYGPGRYEGMLRFRSPGRKPADIPFTLVARESVILASVAILLGVLTSRGVRSYVVSGRRTLEQRAQLARLRDDLSKVITRHQPLVDREDQVKRGLDERAARLASTLAAGDTDDVDASLARLRTSIALFNDLARYDREVANLPDDLQEDVRSALDELGAALSQPDPTSDALDEARKKLDVVKPAALERNSLRRAIEGLRGEVANALQTTANQGLADRLSAEVGEPLAAATKLLGEDDRQASRRSLQDARLAFAKLISEHMEASLSSSPPPGIDAASWDALRNATLAGLRRIESATDAEAALAALGNLRARLAVQRRIGMDKAVRQLRQQLEDNHALTKEARARVEARIDKLAAKVESAAALKDQDALVANEEALADWKELDYQTRATGAVTTPVAAIPVGAGADTWTPAIPAGPEPLPALAATKIEATIQMNDRVVASAVLVVAVLTGVKAIWLSDATWGGLPGYLIAFLWGWGVDAVGRLSIDGLFELRARAAKPD